MAAISCDPSATACWPRIRRFSAAHALTRCRHPLNVPLGADRAALPSTAMCLRPTASHTPAIQSATHFPNAGGSRRVNTR